MDIVFLLLIILVVIVVITVRFIIKKSKKWEVRSGNWRDDGIKNSQWK